MLKITEYELLNVTLIECKFIYKERIKQLSTIKLTDIYLHANNSLILLIKDEYIDINTGKSDYNYKLSFVYG